MTRFAAPASPPPAQGTGPRRSPTPTAPRGAGGPLIGLLALVVACGGGGSGLRDTADDTRPALDTPAEFQCPPPADCRGADGGDAAGPRPDGAPAADAGPAGACETAELCPVRLTLRAPPRVRPGAPFPVEVRAAGADGRPTWFFGTTVTLSWAPEGPAAGLLALRRGAGFALVVAPPTPGAAELRATGAGLTGRAALLVTEADGTRAVAGPLGGADLVWGPGADVRLTADATVPAGATLTVAAGTRVFAAARTHLFVAGALHVNGSAESPVWFAAADPAAPWGGLVVQGEAHIGHAFFSDGGGDPGRAFGHSDSEAVVFVAGGRAQVGNAVFGELRGKALGGERARVQVYDTLITRADMGAEFIESEVIFDGCHFLDIPNGDDEPQDDDNDALYLREAFVDAGGTRLPSRVLSSVFVHGKDDAIDHNGADVAIDACIIEDFAHEGVAGSAGGRLTVSNTLLLDCDQGIEAGYGAPDVQVDHCVLVGHGVGLRVGDSYDWEVSGRLTVTNSISVGNARANVWNYVNRLAGPLGGALSVAHSLVADPAFDGQHGNVPGLPRFDARYRLRADSPGRGAATDGGDVGLLPAAAPLARARQPAE